MRTTYYHTNKGSVLLIGLVIVVLVLGLGIALLTMVTSKSRFSEASLAQHTTYELVQAGLDMARHVLLVGHGNGWDDELVTSHDNGETYNPDDPPIQGVGTDPSLFQWARAIAYHDGSYRALVEDNDDGDGNTLTDQDDIVTLKVKGWLSSGEQSILQALVRYKPPLYEPNNAVVSGGTINISGNTSITGTQGSLGANGDINIGGAAWVEQDAFASGTISGQANIGGNSYEGQSTVDIPDIDPGAYQSLADYELRSNGDVFDVVNTVVAGTATATVSVLGWNYDGSTWITKSTVADGTYYITDGRDVEVAASPGTEANPWQTTLLATGNVTVSSQAVMTPDEPGVVIMARRDVVLSGGIIVQDGMIATHEQMSITGNVDITGMILAEDAEDISPLVSTSSEFNISAGTASITYNGELSTFIDFGDPAVIILGIKREK